MVFDLEMLSADISLSWKKRPLGVWRYSELLPVRDPRTVISLGEGGTRLYHCDRLGSAIGLKRLFVKNEGDNPTGSFKDRGMTVGVSKAIELGMKYTICASTGNTSASLAAYSAKAGLKCIVLIPEGKIALGKIAQAIAYGARIVAIKGGFDDTMRLVKDICAVHPSVYLLNSINPHRLEGQKTIAFELVDQLKAVPDYVVVPVGNAGNISAIWKGFKELYNLGMIDELPKMVGIQAEGAAPLVKAFKKGWKRVEPVIDPKTKASAIRIGHPVNWKKALRAVKESKGLFESVSDEEILRAQWALASHEGIFIEPASAASIAGVIKLRDLGLLDGDELVVCIATGNGLKDPKYVLDNYEVRIVHISAELHKLREYLMELELSGNLKI